MTAAEAKRARELRDADWRWLLGAPQGLRIVAELIAQSGLLDGSFTEQPLRSAFLEGRRSLGAQIYARFTEVTEASQRPALLAQVLLPTDVRDNRRSAPDRDDAAGAG